MTSVRHSRKPMLRKSTARVRASKNPVPPVAWSIFRWSTVICSTSAFSSLEEPCFSKAVGTKRRSSERLLLMRSRRRFSMIPLRFFLACI